MWAENRTSASDNRALQCVSARGAGLAALSVDLQIRRISVIFSLTQRIFLKTNFVFFYEKVILSGIAAAMRS